jgi:hypothetical protein
VKKRAFVIASVFAVLSYGATARDGDAESAVTLDFTPLGVHAVSSSGASAAPADVNFGTFPLSVLGIENTIRNAETRVPDYASGVARIDDGPIAYAVVAIRSWEKQYPGDPWIAKDLLALARFYAHVGTDRARSCAAGAAAWLAHDYPATAYANGARTLLAQLGEPAPQRDRTERFAAAPPPAPPVVRPDEPEVAVDLRVAPGAAPQPARAPVQAANDDDIFGDATPAPAPPRFWTRRRPAAQPTLPPYAHYELPPGASQPPAAYPAYAVPGNR